MPRPRRPQTFLSDEPLAPEQFAGLIIDDDPPTDPPRRREPKDDPARRGDPDQQPGRPDEQQPIPVDPDPIDDDEDNDDGFEDPHPRGPVDVQVPASTMALSEAPPNPTTVAAGQPDLVTYRSRIAVVEAWRYPGSLTSAPAFIDRSWAAYVSDDELSGKPAGPALRVPVAHSTISPSHEGVKICRKGDYVVRQNVTLVDGVPAEEVIDVWPKEEFEKLFIPVAHATGPAKALHPDNLATEDLIAQVA